MAERYQNRIELLQGTLDMLILRALSGGPRHGYGITQTIRAGSRDVLQVETGSLYPALHRMEKRGLVAAEWGITDFNQRAKFYRLTPAGRRQLEAEHARWTLMSEAIHRLMRGDPEVSL
jgi:transcriptional regulator